MSRLILATLLCSIFTIIGQNRVEAKSPQMDVLIEEDAALNKSYFDCEDLIIKDLSIDMRKNYKSYSEMLTFKMLIEKHSTNVNYALRLLMYSKNQWFNMFYFDGTEERNIIKIDNDLYECTIGNYLGNTDDLFKIKVVFEKNSRDLQTFSREFKCDKLKPKTFKAGKNTFYTGFKILNNICYQDEECIEITANNLHDNIFEVNSPGIFTVSDLKVTTSSIGNINNPFFGSFNFEDEERLCEADTENIDGIACLSIHGVSTNISNQLEIVFDKNFYINPQSLETRTDVLKNGWMLSRKAYVFNEMYLANYDLIKCSLELKGLSEHELEGTFPFYLCFNESNIKNLMKVEGKETRLKRDMPMEEVLI